MIPTRIIWAVMCLVFADGITSAPSESVRTEDALVVNAQGSVNNMEEDVIYDSTNIRDLPVKYDGSQLWKISYDSQFKKNAVAELQMNYDVNIWNLGDKTVDMFVKDTAVEVAGKLLENSNITYDVIIDDIQNAIETENPSKDQIELWENRNGHRMTWTAYHRLTDIHGYLDFLATTYPDLCSVRTIGKSFEGRPMKMLRISNGNANNKAIWIDGGIHAREWISPASVTYIIDELVENWEDQPEYIRKIDWYIIPVANPDGYEYTHKIDRLWRKNRRVNDNSRCFGVDLNRNFGYKWGGQGSSREPCSEIYAGSGPFSEPETKSMDDFMKSTAANFGGFISYHSYGEFILYPWGYDRVVPSDYLDLDAVGKKAAAKIQEVSRLSYSVGSSGTILYPAAGGSDDWAKGAYNVKYSYTVELRDSGRYGFILPANQIKEAGAEALIFADLVAKAVSDIS